MFILIMGVTGSGKTTLGKLLSAAMGWPFFDADDFHSPDNVRKMASGLPLTDEDRGPWLQELRALISQHNERGVNGVLACSALKEAYREILTAGADVPVVYLKASPDLIRSRLDSRSGHYMPTRLIESQFLFLEEPNESIIIDAAWPTEQAVGAIRSRLENRARMRSDAMSSGRARKLETAMNEETFNLSIRKFLKMVGVNSQREIEQAVAKAVAARAISGTESLPAKMTLEVADLKLNVSFDGEIKLD